MSRHRTLVLAGLLAAATLAPLPVGSTVGGPAPGGIDLAAHATGWALLARSAAAGTGAASRRDLAVVVLVCLLFGAVTEAGQAFVASRRPSLADLGADAVGSLVGALSRRVR